MEKWDAEWLELEKESLNSEKARELEIDRRRRIMEGNPVKETYQDVLIEKLEEIIKMASDDLNTHNRTQGDKPYSVNASLLTYAQNDLMRKLPVLVAALERSKIDARNWNWNENIRYCKYDGKEKDCEHRHVEVPRWLKRERQEARWEARNG